jgi:hypothetical protein
MRPFDNRHIVPMMRAAITEKQSVDAPRDATFI